MAWRYAGRPDLDGGYLCPTQMARLPWLRRGTPVAVFVAHLYSDPRADAGWASKTSKTVTVLATVATARTAILSLSRRPRVATSLAHLGRHRLIAA